jgi:sulfur carrier protein
MQILINGESRSVAPRTDLPALIEELKLGGRRVAVEINGAVVPRSIWHQVTLSDGDRLEIVHAIGGG